MLREQSVAWRECPGSFPWRSAQGLTQVTCTFQCSFRLQVLSSRKVPTRFSELQRHMSQRCTLSLHSWRSAR